MTAVALRLRRLAAQPYDLAVVGADVRRYARSLMIAAEASAADRTNLAPAATGQASGLLRLRVTRLLDPRRNGEVRPQLGTSMVCAIALGRHS